MSMVVGSSLPSQVDLATWDADISHRDDAYELVEGVPTMTPGESAFNRSVGVALASLLHLQRPTHVLVGTDVDITLREVPSATVRRPDVAVYSRQAALAAREGVARLPASEVLFVAEVVSASSVERDLVTKRREYAQARIPTYLIVDLRTHPGQLTMYTAVDTHGHYRDVTPAPMVTLELGDQLIPIALTDLLP